MYSPSVSHRQSRGGPALRVPCKYVPRTSNAIQIIVISTQVKKQMLTFQTSCSLSETAFIILRCNPSVIPSIVSLRRHLYLNGLRLNHTGWGNKNKRRPKVYPKNDDGNSACSLTVKLILSLTMPHLTQLRASVSFFAY